MPRSVALAVFAVAYADESYQYEIHSRKSWNDARDHCRNHGGELAKVPSASVNDALISLAQSNGYSAVWLGAQDKGTEGDWLWIADRERLADSYTNWCAGNPSQLTGDFDCLALTVSNGCWIDNLCATRLAYVCQVPVSPDASAHEVVSGKTCTSTADSLLQCFAPVQDADACWTYCEENYVLSLAAATSNTSACCCQSQCLCYDQASADTTLAIASGDNPGILNDWNDIVSCDDQSLDTFCSRYGYHDGLDVDPSRSAGSLTCEQVARGDVSGFASCCCVDIQCDAATDDATVDDNYESLMGVSCQPQEGFDDGLVCYTIDYEPNLNYFATCWNHCLYNYALPTAAAYGVPDDNECCCVTKCACYEEDDPYMHLAVATDLPGPNNDFQEIEACPDYDNSALERVYKTGVSCYLDDDDVSARKECSGFYWFGSSATNQDGMAEACWQKCATTYEHPLAVAYGDTTSYECCCLSSCLCLQDDNETIVLAIAADAPGGFNDNSDVESCADYFGSGAHTDTETTDDATEAVLITFAVFFGILAVIAGALYWFRDTAFAKRVIARITPSFIRTRRSKVPDDYLRLRGSPDAELVPTSSLADGDSKDDVLNPMSGPGAQPVPPACPDGPSHDDDGSITPSMI